VSHDAAWTLRRAGANDAASVGACAAEAFRHYIPRLGLTPIPMTRDYGAAIANAQVWVATQQGETEKMTENRALYERIGYVEYKRLAFETRTRVFLRKQLKAADVIR